MTVILKYDFTAAADDSQQLSASKSEEVTLVQKFDDGWWKVRNSNNEEGFVSDCLTKRHDCAIR